MHAPERLAAHEPLDNEMPDPSDADPAYASAYKRTQDAFHLAHQMRLAEAYAYADAAFKQLPR